MGSTQFFLKTPQKYEVRWDFLCYGSWLSSGFRHVIRVTSSISDLFSNNQEQLTLEVKGKCMT